MPKVFEHSFPLYVATRSFLTLHIHVFWTLCNKHNISILPFMLSIHHTTKQVGTTILTPPVTAHTLSEN